MGDCSVCASLPICNGYLIIILNHLILIYSTFFRVALQLWHFVGLRTLSQCAVLAENLGKLAFDKRSKHMHHIMLEL